MRYYLIVFVLLVLFLISFYGSRSVSKDKYEAIVGEPVSSYSGDFLLKVDIQTQADGYDYYIFEVQNINTGKVYKFDESYSVRHATFFFWENDDLWVYSGDVGVFVWKLNSHDFWDKFSDYQVEYVPELLHKRRPDLFKEYAGRQKMVGIVAYKYCDRSQQNENNKNKESGCDVVIGAVTKIVSPRMSIDLDAHEWIATVDLQTSVEINGNSVKRVVLKYDNEKLLFNPRIEKGINLVFEIDKQSELIDVYPE
ncbi:MAG: hypothetical protein JEZ07_11955 [Phycisphaerae bacterium]|nr:hypothetical protein [Phycisphaerae bacterium]